MPLEDMQQRVPTQTPSTPQMPSAPQVNMPKKQTFPKSTEELAKISTELIKKVHDPDFRDRFISGLQKVKEPVKAAELIGQYAGMALLRLTQMITQKGQTPHAKAVVGLSKVAIKELAIIAARMGSPMNQDMLALAGSVAGQVFDQAGKKPPVPPEQEQQQQQPEQPMPSGSQGLIEGVM